MPKKWMKFCKTKQSQNGIDRLEQHETDSILLIVALGLFLMQT